MIGQRIQERRKALQLTQQGLGRKLSVSKATVSLWENNATTPNGANLQRLGKLLRCSPEWLLSGRERDKPSNGSAPKTSVVRISKKDIASLLNGVDAGRFPSGSERDQMVVEAAGAGPRTFILIEKSEGMAPRISPGDAVFIDPDQSWPENGKKIWLFRVEENYLLGSIQDTPRGLKLHFDNTGPGWEPVSVTPGDCVGRVVALKPTWI